MLGRWIRSIRVYTLFYKHVPAASFRAVKPIFFCVCYRFSVARGESAPLCLGATLVPLPAGFHIKQIETPHCVMICTQKHTPDTVYPTMAGRWKEAGGTHRNHSGHLDCLSALKINDWRLVIHIPLLVFLHFCLCVHRDWSCLYEQYCLGACVGNVLVKKNYLSLQRWRMKEDAWKYFKELKLWSHIHRCSNFPNLNSQFPFKPVLPH